MIVGIVKKNLHATNNVDNNVIRNLDKQKQINVNRGSEEKKNYYK